MNAILNTISGMFMGAGRDRKSYARKGRRLSFSQGLEGLEGRLAPGTLLIVTVTNQPPADTTTTQPAPEPTSPPQTTVVSTFPTTQQMPA